MQRNEIKRQYIKYLVEQEGLTKSTALNYWFAKNNPTSKSHNRAQGLFEAFSGWTNQNVETAPNQDKRIERRDKRIALLESQLQDLKTLIDSSYVAKTQVNERINNLVTNNTEQRKKLEYHLNEEAVLKSKITDLSSKITDLSSKIEDRRRLVVITFSDDSVMGFPFSLRFAQIEDTIKNGQIKGIAIINVDWDIKNENSTGV